MYIHTYYVLWIKMDNIVEVVDRGKNPYRWMTSNLVSRSHAFIFSSFARFVCLVIRRSCHNPTSYTQSAFDSRTPE